MRLRDIGAAVLQGQISALELVRRSLERIERLDGELNAVVALRCVGWRASSRPPA